MIFIYNISMVYSGSEINETVAASYRNLKPN